MSVHGPARAVFGLGADNEADDIVATDAAITTAVAAEATARTTAAAVHAAVPAAAGTHGRVKQILVAGQDETGDTTITVTGMTAADIILSVLVLTTAASIATAAFRAVADFTAGVDVVNVVANAANNTNNQYLITYLDVA